MNKLLFFLCMVAILGYGKKQVSSSEQLIASVSATQKNTFLNGKLSVSALDAVNPTHFRLWLSASALPTTGDADDRTTAWLGVNLALFNGQVDSAQFSQVGLTTKREGIFWFVYAESQVTCLRGSQPDPMHCYGAVDDLVQLGQAHRVELQRDPSGNYWVARVFNATGNSFDVARILSTSPRIFAAEATMEEIYFESMDPAITGQFTFSKPQYSKGGVWYDWPQSTHTSLNYIFPANLPGTPPGTICPSRYGITPNLGGDGRNWYAGTGGQVCSWLLFPPIPFMFDNTRTDLITYTGAWSHSSNLSRAYSATLSSSSTNGASASFTLSGTTVSRVYQKGPTRGNTYIVIDGNLTTLNDNSSDTVWQAEKNWYLSSIPAFRSVTVYAEGNGTSSSIDAFRMDAPLVLGSEFYDNDHFQFRYIGTGWTHYTDTISTIGYWGNRVSLSRVAQDGVAFTFYGESLSYIYTTDFNRGIGIVSIDGIYKGEVDLYSPNRENMHVIHYDNLGVGMHTFHLSVSGRKNPSSNDTLVEIDALFVNRHQLFVPFIKR